VTHISIQLQRICVSDHPYLRPRRPSLLRHTGHNGNDCKLMSSSKFRGGSSEGGDCDLR